jgi:hypothetical protein
LGLVILYGDENMPSPGIEEFARILVEHVRDASIESCDRRFQANATSPAARRWKEMARSATPEEFRKVLIADIVDDAISSVLYAVDDGHLKISFSASSGKVVDLNSEGPGELAGWYTGSDGWRAMYTKERFVDYVADLKNYFQS